ncbi:UDP-N-acetylglucosamine 1-carboxyvinyltransferase [Candidatus Woesebacteria bacterium]|nr:UDP-N-acetylglucosamine 1-carboxyvinyltransferase [Candidatus Woesebacteria bacterium]
MSKFIVTGGKKLKGTIKLTGNKNSALKLIPASLLAETPTSLTNVPIIQDVGVMLELVEKLGVKVTGKGTNSLVIDPSGLNSFEPDPELSLKIRASVVLAAPILARFGKAIVTPPGGDQIGERLLDTHFSMMRAMGVEVKRENGRYFLEWKKKKAGSIFLQEASVTATEMGMILASSLSGRVKLEDTASEPHIKDLAEFLTKMGGSIQGVGTGTIQINGKKKMNGCEHKVSPDYIEGGTFVIASAVTGGNIIIEDYIPEDYKMILYYLKNMGVEFKELGGSKLEVFPSKLIAKKRKFQTRPWPGFPTDLMSPFIVLATQTAGTILCHDWMYEWRMFFVDDLISMGANILIADPHRVIINGPTRLMGDFLYSKDIRAGMSLILAALVAQGESTIDNIEMVERGYENLEERFRNLGADIKRVE